MHLTHKQFFNRFPKCKMGGLREGGLSKAVYPIILTFSLYLWGILCSPKWGKKRNAYRLLVGKPEGKRPLGRLRRRWVDNIKMDVLETGWGGVDWIGKA
jgi:hypothetical protein